MKRAAGDDVPGVVAPFPSPKGGGPIEAWDRLAEAVANYVDFPSPKGGGPIEAQLAASDGLRTASLSIAERRWPH